MIIKELDIINTEFGNIMVAHSQINDKSFYIEMLDDPDISVIGTSFENAKEKFRSKLSLGLDLQMKRDLKNIL